MLLVPSETTGRQMEHTEISCICAVEIARIRETRSWSIFSKNGAARALLADHLQTAYGICSVDPLWTTFRVEDNRLVA